MLRIRRFEESAAKAYTRGKISGFLHLYIGQEAIAVATKQAIQPQDRVVSAYRTHGSRWRSAATSRRARRS
jgi:pyruvate dehydrogenase E1 component alpha subunit